MRFCSCKLKNFIPNVEVLIATNALCVIQIARNGDLIIRDVTWLENMGAYTCVADNGFGTDTATTFLYPVSNYTNIQELAEFFG